MPFKFNALFLLALLFISSTLLKSGNLNQKPLLSKEKKVKNGSLSKKKIACSVKKKPLPVGKGLFGVWGGSYFRTWSVKPSRVR